MNSDDMNDAEFDAFLEGEDALSRELQAMPQAGPSAELDATILGRAQALMAGERRPAAANDASDGMVSPPPRLGLRWRVPFGIAATLMAGVLAHQAWQASSDANRAAEVIATAPAPQSAPVPNAAIDAKTVGPAPTVAKVAPSPRQKQPAPHRSAPKSAPTPTEAMSPEMPAAAPPPPPVLSRYSGAWAPAASAESAIADLARAKPTTVDVSGRRSRVASQRSSEQLSSQAAAMTAAPPDPKAWLAAIDELFKAGLRRDTLEEWDKFRAAYPEYPVPAETIDKINALRK